MKSIRTIFRMKQSQPKHNVTANIFSKELVDSTVLKLLECGVTDKTEQAKCAQKLLEATAGLIRGIQRNTAKKFPIDPLFEKYANEMQCTLNDHGVSDSTMQEDIIMSFLNKLGELSVKDMESRK